MATIYGQDNRISRGHVLNRCMKYKINLISIIFSN